MTLREVLNLVSYIMLLLALLTGLFLLDDIYQHRSLDVMESAFVVFSVSPVVLALVTGQAYGVAFIVSLVYGVERVGSRNYSREIAFARQGRGKEAAHGLLWRDRMLGDVAGLKAVLEMARLDPDLKPEAIRAVSRLLGSSRLSKAEKDDVGRMFSRAKISTSKEAYPYPYKD